MASPTQSHLDNFVVNLTLGLLPSSGFELDFSKVLVVDTLANSPQAGLPVTEDVVIGLSTSKLSTIGESDTIPASGAIGDYGKVILRHFFKADIHPTSIQYLSVDLVGGATYSSVASWLKDNNKKFHAVIVASTDESVIAEVLQAFNQQGMSHPVFAGLDDTDSDNDGLPDAQEDLTVLVDHDADPLTPKIPQALPTLAQLSEAYKEQLYLTYHNANGDDTADFAEICALYAATDWDNEAAGGNLVLSETKALGPISQGGKDQLDANFINHALPSFGTDVYVDAGVMFSGRPVYHIYTRDWLDNKLQLAVAKIKTQWAKFRRKLPIDSQGQALILSEIKAVMQQALRAKHTLRAEEAVKRGLPEPYERAEEITSDDVANRRLRFSVLAYFLEDARKIQLNVFVTS